MESLSGFSEEITLKIQTLDSQYPVTVKRQNTISELKEKLCEILNIPSQNLRLIFQGKLLQNQEKIKHYRLTDDSVIHLVVRRTTTSSLEENLSLNLNTNTSNNNNNNSANPQEDIPLLNVRSRNNPYRSRRHLAHFDASDCFECLYQNLLTLGNISSCKNNFDYSSIIQNKTIHPFNFTKAKYEVGQWVDVKDTTDQWLEGQIINTRVNHNIHQVQVHYNGWGTRWDEWIDVNSKRIANFKTYTLPSQNTVFLSPYPTQNCDGIVDSQYRPIDVFYYIEKVNSVMNEIGKSLDHLVKLKKKNTLNEDDSNNNTLGTGKLSLNNFLPFSVNETEILFAASQVIPVLDRCGRLMSDLSLQLAHLILNPNLYPHLLFGHNNEISDSMSCTSGYSMYTNESSSVSGFANNLRFFQEQNIANNLQRNPQPTVTTPTANQTSQNQNNINRTGTNNTQQSSNINNQFSSPRYFLSSSSSELPFIQRLNFSNNLHPNYFNSNSGAKPFDHYPKINLQVPPLLSPSELSMINGYNPLDEQNIFLFSRNVIFDQSHRGNNDTSTNVNNISVSVPNAQHNTECSTQQQKHEEKSDSEDNIGQNSQSHMNSNFQLINTNPILLRNLQARRGGSVLSERSTLSADQMYTRQYRQFKMENEKDQDVPLNLLSLNKEANENNLESISIKSDKNLSTRNKNLSYKSVSEVDEFDEGVEDEKKDNCTVTSHRTEESGYIKEFLEGEEQNEINNLGQGQNTINGNLNNVNNALSNNIGNVNANSTNPNSNGLSPRNVGDNFKETN